MDMLLLVVLVLLCAYVISDWKTKVAYIKDLINTTLGRK
jgi:hypothetical protein